MGRGRSPVWRAAGHPVWRPGQRTPPPPTPRLYIEGTKLSWELSECRQGPTQVHDGSHLRTDAGYLPGVQGRPLRKERHPSTDHGKDSLWLSQLSHSSPETSVGPCSSQGDKQTWGGGLLPNGLHQGRPGDEDPLGLVWLALWVLVHAGPLRSMGLAGRSKTAFYRLIRA